MFFLHPELTSLCSLADLPTFAWLILHVLPTSALSLLLQVRLAHSDQFLLFYTYASITFPLHSTYDNCHFVCMCLCVIL